MGGPYSNLIGVLKEKETKTQRNTRDMSTEERLCGRLQEKKKNLLAH